MQGHTAAPTSPRWSSARPPATSATRAPPTSHLAVEVAQAAVALSGPVELSHLGDVEATRKLGPDGLPEAVAQRHAHAVPAFRLPRWLVQEVAAQLTDVLYDLGAGLV